MILLSQWKLIIQVILKEFILCGQCILVVLKNNMSFLSIDSEKSLHKFTP